MSKIKKQLLAGPYLIWIIGFIILPLFMIVYYAFKGSDGGFTFEYVAAIAHQYQGTAFIPTAWNHMHHNMPGAVLSACDDFKRLKD